MKPQFLNAYLGRSLHNLYQLFLAQAAEVHKARGLSVPVVCASTLQMIGEERGLSIADISLVLGDTHQITKQRVQKLIKLGLVESRPDPTDKRRLVLELTRKGTLEVDALRRTMALATHVFSDLYTEIGCDLSEISNACATAMQRKRLKDRFEAHEATTKAEGSA